MNGHGLSGAHIHLLLQVENILSLNWLAHYRSTCAYGKDIPSCMPNENCWIAMSNIADYTESMDLFGRIHINQKGTSDRSSWPRPVVCDSSNIACRLQYCTLEIYQKKRCVLVDLLVVLELLVNNASSDRCQPAWWSTDSHCRASSTWNVDCVIKYRSSV